MLLFYLQFLLATYDSKADGGNSGPNQLHCSKQVAEVDPDCIEKAENNLELSQKIQQAFQGSDLDCTPPGYSEMSSADCENFSAAMKFQGIKFTHELGGADSKIRLTLPYQLPDRRIAALIEIRNPNGRFLRVAYRSESQGNFRIVPAVYSDKYGGFSISKTSHESSLTLPLNVQKLLLNNLSRTTQLRLKMIPKGEQEAPLVRLTKLRDQFFGNRVQRLEGSNDLKVFSSGKLAHSFLSPENKPSFKGISKSVRVRWYTAPDVGVSHGNLEPDFSTKPETFSFRAPDIYTSYFPPEKRADRLIEAEVYPSKDGSMLYTFFTVPTSTPLSGPKIWLASVEYSNKNSINNFGVPKEQLLLGDLDAPLIEYCEQTKWHVKNVKNSADEDYCSNWEFICKIPIIKKWYKQKNVPIPDCES